ncbi:MAG: hypothetical protein ACFFA0_09425 [Promethearchaeota archaeon]
MNSKNVFDKFLIDECEKIKIMYEEWKSRFSKDDQLRDLGQELFVKHAYQPILIKTVLISKFTSEIDQKDNLQHIIMIFEERGIPLFLYDFF